LLYALDYQLNDMLSEGMENRFKRHLAMRNKAIAWARERGFELFSDSGYASPTVTCLKNSAGIDIQSLNRHLRKQQLIISDGYGPLKGTNFRIAHMGDTQLNDLAELLATIDEFISVLD
jgi:aspartate aminotransferase-like enzyme